jgi:hypothetical protein
MALELRHLTVGATEDQKPPKTLLVDLIGRALSPYTLLDLEVVTLGPGLATIVGVNVAEECKKSPLLARRLNSLFASAFPIFVRKRPSKNLCSYHSSASCLVFGLSMFEYA